MLSQSEKLEQFFFYTILKDFLCIHKFQRYSFKKSLRSAPSAFPSLIGKSEKLEQFFFYTILKDFLCIHKFQRYSFKKSLRSAPSAFPSLIGKSSSFPSSSSFHKSTASMQKLCRTQHAMIV